MVFLLPSVGLSLPVSDLRLLFTSAVLAVELQGCTDEAHVLCYRLLPQPSLATVGAHRVSAGQRAGMQTGHVSERL